MTTKVDQTFREILNRKIGGELHDMCFQCGACVGDCPAARHSEGFNPREIMLMAMLGMEQDLLAENSIIWECTNCNNCYERCPQDVRPVEVIIALKNLASSMRHSPDRVEDIVKSFKKSGATVILTSVVDRRREELGLKPFRLTPMDDVIKILPEEKEK